MREGARTTPSSPSHLEVNMKSLHAEICACPLCEARFPVETSGSSGSYAADSDFRPRFWGPDPLETFVHACPEWASPGTPTISLRD